MFYDEPGLYILIILGILVALLFRWRWIYDFLIGTFIFVATLALFERFFKRPCRNMAGRIYDWCHG